MRKHRCAGIVLLLLLPLPLIADVLILVPGYQSGGNSWRVQGVVQTLVTRGWTDGGNFLLGPDGVRLNVPPTSGSQHVYTVELPTEAALPVQGSYLTRYINTVKRIHPDEKIILAGHSAGGVLARYIMVTQPALNISTLVTIASPHSGTVAANVASVISNSPAAWMAPLFGLSTINRSRDLYRELGRPDSNNLLGWLNTRQHPRARYISIIHLNDEWVDATSQDMNKIPALMGKSLVLTAATGHALGPEDGVMLANLLSSSEK